MFLQRKIYGYLDMVTLALKTSPLLSILSAVPYVLSALLPTAQIFIMAGFVNGAIEVYQGTANISVVYAFTAMLVAITAYNSFGKVLMSRIYCHRDIQFRNKIAPLILEKQALLEYRHIENPDSIDLIHRVCPNLDQKISQMYTDMLSLISFAVYVTGIMITLFTQSWWIALIMLASAIPLVYIASKSGKESYGADREMTKTIRRFNYIAEVLTGREAVDERNVFGYVDELNRQYDEKFEIYRKFRLKVARRNFIKYRTGAMLSVIYIVVAMLVLVGPVSRGEMNLGMFIALIGAIIGLAERLSAGIEAELKKLAQSREFLYDLTKVMALEEEADATALPHQPMDFNVIEFKNVRFKYPGTDKLVLDDVSFIIEKGKHYSFVGENGAGKTTITKLITGLYSNYEGDILVDGKCLREMTQSRIKGLASVVFQDFAKYYVSLYDNIVIGNLNGHTCEKEVRKVLDLVGLSEAVNKLKDGLNTPLGKIIKDGVDISHGEWQRTAMARSIISKNPLKILDEPTSALDPVSESMIYESYKQIAKKDSEETVIFISHRLGSTKLADVIYVLAGGKIVEEGSHNTLMDSGGLYAEMYKTQAQWYSDAKGDLVHG